MRIPEALTADDHDDGAMLFADIRHDPTCPNWAAFCKDSNHRDVLWGPITP